MPPSQVYSIHLPSPQEKSQPQHHFWYHGQSNLCQHPHHGPHPLLGPMTQPPDQNELPNPSHLHTYLANALGQCTYAYADLLDTLHAWVQAAEDTKVKVKHKYHHQAIFIAGIFRHSLKSIAASLNPFKKMKSWHQIHDDYTQDLLGSTLSHHQTREPHEVREVLLLQDHHQPELIVLGRPTCTTMAQPTTFDLFSHWTSATPYWAPVATTSRPPARAHPTRPTRPSSLSAPSWPSTNSASLSPPPSNFRSRRANPTIKTVLPGWYLKSCPSLYEPLSSKPPCRTNGVTPILPTPSPQHLHSVIAPYKFPAEPSPVISTFSKKFFFFQILTSSILFCKHKNLSGTNLVISSNFSTNFLSAYQIH